MSESKIKAAWVKIQASELDNAVAEVKLLMAEIHQRRMKIAEIAIRVCVTDGRCINRLVNRPEGLITVAEFAERTGIAYDTLRGWMSAYQYGAKVINPKDPSSVPYTEARRAAKVSKLNAKVGKGNVIKSKAPRIKVMTGIGAYSVTYLEYVTKFNNMIKTQGVRDIPDGVKSELRIKLKQILKALN